MSGTNIDLLTSLSQSTSEPLKVICEKLFNALKNKGYAHEEQNVSIDIRVNVYSVSLVPGKVRKVGPTDIGLTHSAPKCRCGRWPPTGRWITGSSARLVTISTTFLR
jgi:hypothetical protein